MFDGDTIFGLSVGGATSQDGNRSGAEAASPQAPASLLFHQLLAVAAYCFTRAIVRGVLPAASATTPGGHWPAYLDVFGSADRR